MLKKILDHKTETFSIIGLILLLAIIRNYESQIFYDPFLRFFKGNYQNQALPEFDSFKLFANFFFRYFLNTAVSLAILYMIFKQREIITISSFLYLVFFVILITLFFLAVAFYKDNFVIFYIRRFIIQPIFLLLFVPGFYYQRQVLKK